MLLLLVLSTAAIFSPALSQPARSDVFDEGDYPFPLYRGRVDWGEAVDRPHKAMGIPTGDGLFRMKVQPGNTVKDKSMQELTKDKQFEKDMVPVRLARRQFVVDPIGGGYLLRRESGPEGVSKKSFPLDPIGGGYLLKRNAQGKQYDILEPFNRKNELSKKPRGDFSVRLIPKEDILSTSATGDSYINSKDLHLLGAGLESFPIDPIGGGLLLDVANMLRDLQAMRMASMYPQQGRFGKSVDPSGIPPYKASKRFDGLRMAVGEKRNFDEIDRSGFNSFIKRNFDEIDRSGFNSLIKKNFDEIDRNGFNSLVKRSANGFESSNH